MKPRVADGGTKSAATAQLDGDGIPDLFEISSQHVNLAKAIPRAAPREGLDVRVSVLPQQDRATTHGLYEVTLSHESRIVWRSLADDM